MDRADRLGRRTLTDGWDGHVVIDVQGIRKVTDGCDVIVGWGALGTPLFTPRRPAMDEE
jgi:hypothetical protein